MGHIEDSDPATTEGTGLAWNAKLAFHDVGKDGELTGIPNSLSDDYFPQAQRAGAHISSNSWGNR